MCVGAEGELASEGERLQLDVLDCVEAAREAARAARSTSNPLCHVFSRAFQRVQSGVGVGSDALAGTDVGSHAH